MREFTWFHQSISLLDGQPNHFASRMDRVADRLPPPMSAVVNFIMSTSPLGLQVSS